MAGDKPWTEVRSPNFRVITDAGPRDARHLAREFEQMRAIFAQGFPTLHLDPHTPLLVLAPKDEAGMKKLFPEFWQTKSAKPAGVFIHGWEQEYAVVQLDQVQPGAYNVVYHEYVHSILDLNFRWIPVWLNEGLAEFYGNSVFRHDDVVVGAASPRFSLVRSRSLIPIDTLLEVDAGSHYYRDEDKVQMFYGEAWALTHFLIFGPGMQTGARISQFANLLQQGVEQKKAFQQVFGDSRALEKNLSSYLHNFTLTAWVVKNPPDISEESFSTRTLSLAETETELGAYHVRHGRRDAARPLLERAVQDDPQLASAREKLGFLHFLDNDDAAALRDFTEALRLDPTRYLSLYYATMLSPAARSSAAEDQKKFEQGLMATLAKNDTFAPAYVELARLRLRQGRPQDARGLALRAAELEPHRAGYYTLVARIEHRTKRDASAAAIAKFVAERWTGSDRYEAIEVLDSLPPELRPTLDPAIKTEPESVLTGRGVVKSIACDPQKHRTSIFLQQGDKTLEFRSDHGFGTGFSDTLWFGADHFDLCHHVEGLRALVRYHAVEGKDYAGDLTQLEIRDDLPEATAADSSAVHP